MASHPEEVPSPPLEDSPNIPPLPALPLFPTGNATSYNTMEEAMTRADADEATRVAAVVSAEAKKQRDEKNQKKMEMFAFTSKDVMNITPKEEEFNIVMASHNAGIAINKSDLLSRKVAIDSLREEASRMCTEGKYAKAQGLEDEASELNKSYRGMDTFSILSQGMGSHCPLSNFFA